MIEPAGGPDGQRAVSFRYLEVAGAPRELGRQIGEGARDLVARALAYYDDHFEELYSLSYPEAERRARALLPYAERDLPQYVEELAGMTEGADVPFAKLLVANCGEELSRSSEAQHCTSLAIAGETGAILAHNEDWNEGDIENQLLLRMTTQDGTQILSMTTACFMPMTGLNSHGIATAANSVYARDVRAGVPNSFVRRWVLEAHTRGEAVDRACCPARACGSNHAFADRLGHIWDVETSGTAHATIEAQQWFVHTNHYLAAELQPFEAYASAGSVTRLDRARQLLDAGLASGYRPVELAALILRDHGNAPDSICSHPPEPAEPANRGVTTASMIWDVTENRMHVCAGLPCQQPYQLISL